MVFSLAALGALALTANAILIPLDSDNFAANDLSVNRGPQLVKLDCSTCPYALKSERNGEHEWTNDVPNDLEMKFEILDNAITFNGVALYPANSPGFPPPLTVSQNPKDGVETSMEGLGHDLRLSYSLEMAQKPFDDGDSLVTITISPMALDAEMIRVDDMEVKAIKDSAGTMTLHSVTTISLPQDASDAQCSNVMCRVMSKLLGSIARVKSTAKAAVHKVKCVCAKCLLCVMRMMGHKYHHHMGAHGAPGIPHHLPEGSMELPAHHHFQPQDGGPHSHHQHKWHNKGFFGRMAHILWVTVKIAFIPILIGIAFGMAASAIGMLVGQAVVFLWMRYRHNGEAPAYEQLPTDEKEEIPPPYEDLPIAVQEAINEKDVEAKA